MADTFIYLAGMYGLELPLLQGLVGHMTAEMTKMYMDHATDEAKRTAMQRMPNFLGETPDRETLPADNPSEGALDAIREQLQDLSLPDLETIGHMVEDLIAERRHMEPANSRS